MRFCGGGVLSLTLLAVAATARREGSQALFLRQTTVATPTVERVLEDPTPRLIALDARKAVAFSRAEAGASQAKISLIRAAKLNMQGQMQKMDLERLMAATTASAEQAAGESKRAVGSVKELTAMVTTVPQQASQLAIQGVQQLLIGKFNSLAGWRDRVLVDPNEESARAAARAAEPYDKVINTFYGRMQNYQAEAKGLMSQADAAASAAKSMASTAQSKIEMRNVIGANQEMEMAKAQNAKAAAFGASAQKIQASADGMNTMIPQYVAAEQTAAWQAAKAANPMGLLPPIVDPNTGYAPPPPA